MTPPTMTTYFSADHGALVVGDIYTNKLKTILRVYLYPCNKFILHSHSTISNDKIPTEFNNMHIFADDDRKHWKGKALNLLKAKITSQSEDILKNAFIEVHFARMSRN